MMSEGRPVELWGLRADDYGEAQRSQRIGNMRERAMLWMHSPLCAAFSPYLVYSEK